MFAIFMFYRPGSSYKKTRPSIVINRLMNSFCEYYIILVCIEQLFMLQEEKFADLTTVYAANWGSCWWLTKRQTQTKWRIKKKTKHQYQLQVQPNAFKQLLINIIDKMLQAHDAKQNPNSAFCYHKQQKVLCFSSAADKQQPNNDKKNMINW